MYGGVASLMGGAYCILSSCKHAHVVGDYFSLAMEPRKKAKVDEANNKFAKAILG